MKRYFLLVVLTLQSFFSTAQLLQDNESKQAIMKGLDKLYNFEFKEAESHFHKVKVKYSNHPVHYLINALQIQWQNLPIEKNPKALPYYIQSLEKCRDLAEKLYEDKSKSAEASFFLLASHGYIALMHNYAKDYMKAANEARKAYGYVKEGFKMMEKNPEFYFTTGLYNFYIVQFPETHSVVKPLMVFFDDGNKKLGLQQLEIASQKASFLRIESLWYLTGINLKYESNPNKSLIYSKVLKESYPNNYLYLMRHTEGLVFSGKYDEAQAQIALLRRNKNSVYQVAANMFDGYIAEKYKKNDTLASEYYNATIRLPNSDYADDYIAMAYAGLARIASKSGNKKKAEALYNKCLDFAEYTSTIKEAKSFK